MPMFAEPDPDNHDPGDRHDLFYQLSRQVLYQALLADETGNVPLSEDDMPAVLQAFGRYLAGQMADDRPEEEQVTVEAWVRLARTMRAKGHQTTNLSTLAEKVYHLLRQELRLERERTIRPKSGKRTA